MAATSTERYVVASCHVERPLDDGVWAAFAALQARRPGGITVAALMRPPDPRAGEHNEELWLERAHEAALHGPLGHHTHWTSPTHARPSGADPAGDRVSSEGQWIRARGLAPRLFCGGGWFSDASVASACAALGYADCTPRPAKPPYLAEDAARLELDRPARVELGDGQLLVALPTTHSAGDGVRTAFRGGPRRVHVYFHDTDLVDRRRRRIVVTALRLLGQRYRARTLLDELDGLDDAAAAPVAWTAIVRP